MKLDVDMAEMILLLPLFPQLARSFPSLFWWLHLTTTRKKKKKGRAAAFRRVQSMWEYWRGRGIQCMEAKLPLLLTTRMALPQSRAGSLREDLLLLSATSSRREVLLVMMINILSCRDKRCFDLLWRGEESCSLHYSMVNVMFSVVRLFYHRKPCIFSELNPLIVFFRGMSLLYTAFSVI